MEKRDLEVLVNGCIIGAFENVRDVVETENSISFKSDDGEYKYEKGANGIYKCVEADEAAKATCLDSQIIKFKLEEQQKLISKKLAMN